MPLWIPAWGDVILSPCHHLSSDVGTVLIFLALRCLPTSCLWTLAGLMSTVYVSRGGVLEGWRQKGVSLQVVPLVASLLALHLCRLGAISSPCLTNMTSPSPADFVCATGDYHHIEQATLPKELRNYTEEHWDRQTMSPSSLLFFLGCSKRLQSLRHHNLFFDESLEQHAKEIYDQPRWPSKPLFYVCVQSMTDPATAPQGHENVFICERRVPAIPRFSCSHPNRHDSIMR